MEITFTMPRVADFAQLEKKAYAFFYEGTARGMVEGIKRHEEAVDRQFTTDELNQILVIARHVGNSFCENMLTMLKNFHEVGGTEPSDLLIPLAPVAAALGGSGLFFCVMYGINDLMETYRRPLSKDEIASVCEIGIAGGQQQEYTIGTLAKYSKVAGAPLSIEEWNAFIDLVKTHKDESADVTSIILRIATLQGRGLTVDEFRAYGEPLDTLGKVEVAMGGFFKVGDETLGGLQSLFERQKWAFSPEQLSAMLPESTADSLRSCTLPVIMAYGEHVNRSITKQEFQVLQELFSTLALDGKPYGNADAINLLKLLSPKETASVTKTGFSRQHADKYRESFATLVTAAPNHLDRAVNILQTIETARQAPLTPAQITAYGQLLAEVSAAKPGKTQASLALLQTLSIVGFGALMPEEREAVMGFITKFPYNGAVVEMLAQITSDPRRSEAPYTGSDLNALTKLADRKFVERIKHIKNMPEIWKALDKFATGAGVSLSRVDRMTIVVEAIKYAEKNRLNDQEIPALFRGMTISRFLP